MKNNLVLILLIISSFSVYVYIYGLFTSSSTNAANSFSASAVFPSVTPTIESIASPSAQVADHIVISEVQINGANANQDFVELYNPTNSTVDLNGWQLNMKNSSGTNSSLVLIGTGKSIPAYGFFLWANNQSGYSTSIGADDSNGNNIGENNSLELEDASDNTVDQVGWGNVTGHYIEGTPLTNGPDSNSSIERKANSTSTQSSMEGGTDSTKGNGFDAGNNATDFVLRSVSDPQNSGSLAETP